MNTTSLHPHWWKGVTLMLIIWALAGIGAFLGQFTMSSEATAQLPPEQQEMWVKVLVQFSYPFVIADGLRTLGPSALIFPAFIIAMVALQSRLARSWANKGWLK